MKKALSWLLIAGMLFSNVSNSIVFASEVDDDPSVVESTAGSASEEDPIPEENVTSNPESNAEVEEPQISQGTLYISNTNPSGGSISLKCNNEDVTTVVSDYSGSFDVGSEIYMKVSSEENYAIEYLKVNSEFWNIPEGTTAYELSYTAGSDSVSVECGFTENIVEATATPAPTELFLEKAEGVDNLDASKFATARLVVLADSNSVIVDPEHLIASYGNIYLLQYNSVEQSMNAYMYYSANARAVEPDITLKTAEEQGTQPTEETKVEVTEESNPISAITEEGYSDSARVEKSAVIALIDTGASECSNVIDRVSLIDDVLNGGTHGDNMIKFITEENPSAKILSIRALGNDGKGTVSSIVAAIEYAINQNVDIINLSLYARTNLLNSVLESEIQKAASLGIKVVGSAGNDGVDAADYMPGSVKEAYIIGACEENGVRLSSSNYGSTVDVNVVAKSTSEAAARFSGYISANGVNSIRLNSGMFYETSYTPSDPEKKDDVTETTESNENESETDIDNSNGEDNETKTEEANTSDNTSGEVEEASTYVVSSHFNVNGGFAELLQNDKYLSSLYYTEGDQDLVSVDSKDNLKFNIYAFAGYRINSYSLTDTQTGNVLKTVSEVPEEDKYGLSISCEANQNLMLGVSFVEDASSVSSKDENTFGWKSSYVVNTLTLHVNDEFNPETQTEDFGSLIPEGCSVELVYSDVDTTAEGLYSTVYHVTGDDVYFALRRPVEVVTEDVETEGKLYINFLSSADKVNFDTKRFDYNEGDTVEFSVTPLDSAVIDSVKAYVSIDTEDANLVLGDEIELTALDSAEDSSSESVFVNDKTLYYSFTMPSRDVFIQVNAVDDIVNAAVEGGSDDALTKFTVTQHEGGYAYWNPSVCIPYNGKAAERATRYRTVTYNYKKADGTIASQTVMCYCIEPQKHAPLKNGDTVFSSSNGSVQALSDASIVSKALFYLYGGPMWNKSVEDKDGNLVNMKTVLDKYPSQAPGTVGNGSYYALTHFILGYLYTPTNEAVWNYPDDGYAGQPMWNSTGKSWLASIKTQLSKLPKPTTLLKKGSTDISGGTLASSSLKKISETVYRTPTLTYSTYDENTGAITLPKGVSMTYGGNTYTGKVLNIPGGTKFYLTLNLAKMKINSSNTCNLSLYAKYGANYEGWKIVFSGGNYQDLGFGYRTGNRIIGLTIELPEKGHIKITKDIRDITDFADSTPLISLSTTFEVYDSTLTTLVAKKKLSVDEGTYTGSVTFSFLNPGTYYIRETGKCPGCVLNTHVYMCSVKAGTTTTSFYDTSDSNKVVSKITNIPWNFKGIIAKKFDEKTKAPLADAIFKVVYSPWSKTDTDKYDESLTRTYYLKSDSEGNVKYDSSHYLASWTDKGTTYNSSTALKLADGSWAFPVGYLYVTEVKAPSGYALIPGEQFIDLSASKDDDGNYTIEPITVEPLNIGEPRLSAGLKIQKVSSDTTYSGSLAGAKFKIYTDQACTTEAKTFDDANIGELTTKADGYTDSVELKIGTYYIKETSAPTGFNMCAEDEGYGVGVHRVDVETKGTSYTCTCKDAPSALTLAIKKTSASPSITNGNSCYSLEGAEYSVYTNQGCTTPLMGANGKQVVLVTDRNGNSQTVKVAKGIYYVKETKASKGYKLCAEDTGYGKGVHKIDCAVYGESYTVNCKEEPSTVKRDPLNLFLRKKDAVTGGFSPAGKGTLGGAEFTVKYYDKTPISSGDTPVRKWVFKTDPNGNIAFVEDSKYFVSGDALYKDANGEVNIPMGTVTFQETKAPNGYLIDDTVYTVNLAEDPSKNIVYNAPVVSEVPLSIKIVKKSFGTNQLLQGAEFTHICPDGSTEIATSDENGELVFYGLEHGNHTVYESKSPDGYLVNENRITFSVANDNKITVTSTSTETNTSGKVTVEVKSDGTLEAEVVNKPNNYRILINKKNDQNKVLSGAEFTLYSDSNCTQQVSKGTTNANGTLSFDSLKMYTTYYMKETKAPQGYKSNIDIFGRDVVWTVRMELNKDGSKVLYVNGNKCTTDSKELYYLSEENGDSVANMSIINTVGRKLPETGSSLTLLLVLVGVALMVTGLVVRNRNNKKK